MRNIVANMGARARFLIFSIHFREHYLNFAAADFVLSGFSQSGLYSFEESANGNGTARLLNALQLLI